MLAQILSLCVSLAIFTISSASADCFDECYSSSLYFGDEFYEYTSDLQCIDGNLTLSAYLSNDCSGDELSADVLSDDCSCEDVATVTFLTYLSDDCDSDPSPQSTTPLVLDDEGCLNFTSFWPVGQCDQGIKVTEVSGCGIDLCLESCYVTSHSVGSTTTMRSYGLECVDESFMYATYSTDDCSGAITQQSALDGADGCYCEDIATSTVVSYSSSDCSGAALSSTSIPFVNSAEACAAYEEHSIDECYQVNGFSAMLTELTGCDYCFDECFSWSIISGGESVSGSYGLECVDDTAMILAYDSDDCSGVAPFSDQLEGSAGCGCADIGAYVYETYSSEDCTGETSGWGSRPFASTDEYCNTFEAENDITVGECFGDDGIYLIVTELRGCQDPTTSPTALPTPSPTTAAIVLESASVNMYSTSLLIMMLPVFFCVV